MFLFEQMFNTALSGISTAGLMSTIFTVAYGILLASLLFSTYEAWTRGGDVRALGVSALKYLALGLLFANGGAVYDSVIPFGAEALSTRWPTRWPGSGRTMCSPPGRTSWSPPGRPVTFLNVITGGVSGDFERGRSS